MLQATRVIAVRVKITIEGANPSFEPLDPPLKYNAIRFRIPAITPDKPLPVITAPLYLGGKIPAASNVVP